MPTRRSRRDPSSVYGPFPGDLRDRRPGTHFAADLGGPPRSRRRSRTENDDPHVDEDLGVSAYGIELPFLKH